MEQEANAFAVELLMPSDLVRIELEKVDFDFSSEEAIKKIAKMFGVSSTAMYYLLSNLRLVSQEYE